MHPGERIKQINERTIALEERMRNNPYKGKYALDPKGMEIFRKKIRDRVIPIGPIPDHSEPVKDIRDKTDPQTIGNQIIARSNGGN